MEMCYRLVAACRSLLSREAEPLDLHTPTLSLYMPSRRPKGTSRGNLSAIVFFVKTRRRTSLKTESTPDEYHSWSTEMSVS